MLSADVQITDINPDHIGYFASVLAPQPAPVAPATLFVFYEGNRLIHAVHNRRGPVPGLRFHGAHRLDTLARAYGVDSVVCIERGALPRLSTVIANRVRWDDPFLFQLLAFVDGVRGETGGGIHFYPSLKGKVPRVTPGGVRFASRFLPREALYTLIVFDNEGGVRASMIIGARGAEIDLITTTEALGPAGPGRVDTAGLPLEERVRRINAAAARSLRQPTASFFMDDDVFRHLCAHPRPLAAVRRLHASGWLTINPFPLKLRLLLGLLGLIRI
ncbi:MAG: hypothetical protein ABIH66_10600 [bacterium]